MTIEMNQTMKHLNVLEMQSQNKHLHHIEFELQCAFVCNYPFRNYYPLITSLRVQLPWSLAWYAICFFSQC